MHNDSLKSIVIFVILCVLLIVFFISFVTYIIYKYQQKQNSFLCDMEELKSRHRNEMLQSQVEIQEQTFENISREIHDNIGQKLTLAKLYLNTLNLSTSQMTLENLHTSIALISDSISDLSDISRSLSAEVIEHNGLIKALELEVAQIKKSSLFNISLEVNGEPIFMESQKELIIFRIIQESLSNIMKHAAATMIRIVLNYKETILQMNITDNGIGFTPDQQKITGTGIANMKRRTVWLNGKCVLQSNPGAGTNINIEIPIV